MSKYTSPHSQKFWSPSEITRNASSSLDWEGLTPQDDADAAKSLISKMLHETGATIMVKRSDEADDKELVQVLTDFILHIVYDEMDMGDYELPETDTDTDGNLQNESIENAFNYEYFRGLVYGCARMFDIFSDCKVVMKDID